MRMLPLVLLLLTLPAVVQAQLGYVTNSGEITITGYTGNVGAVTIPSTVNGLPAISIGSSAFGSCTSLASVTIPNSVTDIGIEAFQFCSSLTGVFFQGNAPSLGGGVFFCDNNVTVYYLLGTTGWGTMFGDHPAALWKTELQTSGASFGVRTNQFGFTITWASGMTIVVEACTNLANPIWYPLATNTLTDGWSYFSDPQWTNYPARFYRLRSP